MATIVTRAGKGSNLTPTEADTNLTNINAELIAATSGVAANASAITNKQATLVSGTNLRTVNGQSLLGSTDITIAGGSGPASTDALTEGTTNLYFTNPRAIAATLTSYAKATANAAISAADTLLSAMGKLERRVDDYITTFITVTQTADYLIPDFTTGEKALEGVTKVYKIQGNGTNSIGFQSPMRNGNGNTLDNTLLNIVQITTLAGVPTFFITKFSTVLPVLSSATTNSDGTSIILTFNIAIGAQSIVIKKNGATYAGTYAIIGSTVVFTPGVAAISADVLVFQGTVTDNNVNVRTYSTDQVIINAAGSVTTFDGFNSANTTDIAGRSTPTGGYVWARVIGTDTIGIVSNAATFNSSGGTGEVWYMLAVKRNADVTFKIGSIGATLGYLGLYIAYTDNNNWIRINTLTGGIDTKVAGTQTSPYAGAGSFASSDIIRVVLTSSNLVSLYKNGTLIQSGISVSSALTGIKIGLSLYTSSAGTLDEITIV